MSRTRKPQREWAVTFVNRSTHVMPHSIRFTREAAIKAALSNLFPLKPGSDWRCEWHAWRKQGCRAVRVNITVEPQA